MLNPNLKDILKNHLSRYSLVTATAKRARQIALENEENNVVSTEKPVSVALQEIIEGKYTIVEPEEIRDI
ncbi:MAG: DNA-directed RNA polymerase subunit omega [Firmicutes bacterium ADurb.Bin300]|jgi:DNA-directed RNA polymerase subunit omega|nr:MAG: DNA-directed RNA polymerase subunit omega [Firmicutes bacterium ADurb.Bin300]